MLFLAIIGLIAILWLAKRFFNNIGKFFDKLADDMTHKVTARVSTKRDFYTDLRKQKTKDKIDTIKGNDTDDEYWVKVRNDIKEIIE